MFTKSIAAVRPRKYTRPEIGRTPRPNSRNCEGTDIASIAAPSSVWNASPISSAKTGTAQKRAPRMNATVTFPESNDATIPIASSIPPIRP